MTQPGPIAEVGRVLAIELEKTAHHFQVGQQPSRSSAPIAGRFEAKNSQSLGRAGDGWG
jgi:hypothetical protein